MSIAIAVEENLIPRKNKVENWGQNKISYVLMREKKAAAAKRLWMCEDKACGITQYEKE